MLSKQVPCRELDSHPRTQFQNLPISLVAFCLIEVEDGHDVHVIKRIRTRTYRFST